MVISDEHRYLFLELPHTGSTAVRRELIEKYDGVPILCRHATYDDFLRHASDEQKKYVVFGCVRDPADIAVSLFVRYKTDRNQKFTDSRKIARRNIVDKVVHGVQFNFIRRRDADFSRYFLNFYRLPYNTWSSISFKHCRFIMRYENLAGDFERALHMIGLEPLRPLPVVNRTERKRADFWSYYSPDAAARAVRVFGPYMKEWGYEFPPDWEVRPTPWWYRFLFRLVTGMRIAYWRYVRPRVMRIPT